MTIVLCGGGSGGHITPLLAVAAELKKQDQSVRLIYIGEKGGKFASIAKDSRLFNECHEISAGKLRRYHGESLLTRLFDVKTNFLNIRDVFKLSLGMVQSYFLIRKLDAGALLLKGGFVCVPVAAAARAHGLSFITHDSDALPGLSNRLAARWARYNATALPAQYYNYPKDRIKVTGVPTDDRFRVYSEPEQAIIKEKYGIAADAPVLLVTGGSNGARRLNNALISIMHLLLSQNPSLHILHQTGQGNEDQITDVVKNVDVQQRVHFFEFSSELFHMSAIADLVVTRAGASAMADYAVQSKACLLVPNPYLTGGHQMKNAQVFEEANAAEIAYEAEILETPSILQQKIQKLLDSPERRAELGKNLNKLVPQTNAARAIADLLKEIAR